MCLLNGNKLTAARVVRRMSTNDNMPTKKIIRAFNGIVGSKIFLIWGHPTTFETNRQCAAIITPILIFKIHFPFCLTIYTKR